MQIKLREIFSKLSELAQPRAQQVNDWYRSLSERERYLGLAMVGGLLLVLAFQSVSFAVEKWALEGERLEAMHQELEEATPALEQFLILSAKTAELEKKFKEVPRTVSTRAYLADLAKESGIDSNPTITFKDDEEEQIGQRLKRVPGIVTIRSAGLKETITFLEKIENSEQPLVITQLNLRKQGARGLYITMHISSISQG